MALGPLVLAYACAWTDTPLRPRLRVHLIPAGLHLAYALVCFALPLSLKQSWAATGDATVVAPLIATLAPLSLSAYTLAAFRTLRRYQSRLSEVVAQEARYAAVWLQRALVALLPVLALFIGYQAWELAAGGLDYFQRLNLYLAFAGLALYLAVEGWRHADLRLPDFAPAPRAAPAPRDWIAQAQAWSAAIDRGEWWRDPELTLAELAARLGTNTYYVSRALNEGLGQNFAQFINGRRARAVAEALAAGSTRPLMDLALKAGFNSKASFNRAFRAAYGESPSAARRRGSMAKSLAADPDLRRAET